MANPTDPNVSTLTSAGLAVESKPNLIAFLQSAFQQIYGTDINVDSNSPDGQLLNIFAQCDEDLLELLLDAYNSCAVPTSYGVRLDQLVALNGIQRKQGTYTNAFVLVTATAAVTLPGLDQTAVTPFTVSDNAGNQFQLVTSHVFSGAGSATLQFQAVDIGEVQTTANTITNIVTATLGISTVNNPSTASDSIGVNEETDAQLKVRHDQSFQFASTGPSDAIESALRNIPAVIDAYVVENDTNAPAGGIPANGIWPIVNYGASPSTDTLTAVATAIYSKKSIGAAITGAQSFTILRPNGTTYTAQWDLAISQPLYIKFSVIWRGSQVLSNATIESQLAAALQYKLGENPSIGDIVTAMATIAPTAIVTINSSTQGVSSDNATWESLVAPTDAQHYFTVSATNIVVS